MLTIVLISFLIVIIILLVFILIKVSKNNNTKNIINTSININDDNSLIDKNVDFLTDINTNLKFNLVDIKTELENKNLINNSLIFEINKSDKSLVPIRDTVTKFGVESIITLFQSSKISQLYKATADPNTLMQLASGGLGSAVIKNGKIIQQAGFVAVNPIAIMSPQIIFSLLSIVVGQHYMSEISSQLSTISDKLDKILQHFKNEHESKLEAATEKILYISNLQYVGMEQIINLDRLEDDVNTIYCFYRKKLKNFNIDNINTDKVLYKNKLKNLDELLNIKLKSAEYSYNICIYSKELLNMIKLIKYNSYLKMDNVDVNAVNKSNELLYEIKKFNEDIFFYEEYNPKKMYIEAISKSENKLSSIYRDNKLYYSYSNKYKSDKEKVEKNKYISISYNKAQEMLKKFDKPIDTYYFTEYGQGYLIINNQ